MTGDKYPAIETIFRSVGNLHLISKIMQYNANKLYKPNKSNNSQGYCVNR